MAETVLYEKYQNVLSINPKYNKLINCSATPPKGREAMRAIVNLCAYSIINYDYIQQIPYRKAFGVQRTQDKKFKCVTFTTKTIKYQLTHFN